MQEIELYHVHLKNDFDSKWRVKNVINVDEKFNSGMNKRQQNFSQTVMFDNCGEQILSNFSGYIYKYYERIKNLRTIKNDDLEDLKQLLEIGFEMSFYADFFKRECALETCRKDNFTDKPSRLHSIYLCDQDGLEYWSNIISKNNQEQIEVFRVLAQGNIFKTNEQLLPNETKNYEDTYNSSFSYWSPKFSRVHNYSNEYLAQGKIKILSQIK